jgi:hypothetical protein
MLYYSDRYVVKRQQDLSFAGYRGLGRSQKRPVLHASRISRMAALRVACALQHGCMLDAIHQAFRPPFSWEWP